MSIGAAIDSSSHPTCKRTRTGGGRVQGARCPNNCWLPERPRIGAFGTQNPAQTTHVATDRSHCSPRQRYPGWPLGHRTWAEIVVQARVVFDVCTTLRTPEIDPTMQSDDRDRIDCPAVDPRDPSRQPGGRPQRLRLWVWEQRCLKCREEREEGGFQRDQKRLRSEFAGRRLGGCQNGHQEPGR
jgi:hypothetical protein